VPDPTPKRNLVHDAATADTFATTAEERATARTLYEHLEVLHTLTYFAPAVHKAHAELGLALPWGGYTAGRIAPMGPVGPEVATAVFYGFSPTLLQDALPTAWETTTPARVLDVTAAAVDATLTELLEEFDGPVARAAELAREAALLHPIVGRPLAAARSSLPWPDAPRLLLWEAATRIRESRGDGHVATLVAAGIDGCEAHLTLGGDGDKIRRVLQPLRGWTDAEWDAAVARLQDRGILDAAGEPTDHGRAVRADIEERTDAAAVPPWRAFGAHRTEQLLEALRPIVRPVADAGILPGVVTRRVS
jgi:hypothetical protein